MANELKFTIKADDEYSGTFDKLNKSALPALTAAVAATGAAFAAASVAIFKLTENTAQSAAALYENAQALGVTTEALSGLNYAASQMGSNSESLANGLKFLTRNIAEASAGNQGLITDFNALGVSISDIRNLSPDEQFMAIAKGFDSISNTSDRVKLAMDIFGRGGMDMLKVMQDGSGAIVELNEEAKRMGNIIGADFARNADTFDDKLGKMKAATQGLAIAFVGDLMPVFTSAMNTMAEMLASNRALFESLGAWAIKAFDFMVSAASASVPYIITLWYELQAAWLALKLTFYGLTTAISSGLALIASGVAEAIGIFKPLGGVFETVANGAMAVADGLKEAAKSNAASVEQTANDIANLGAKYSGALSDGEKFAAQLDKLGTEYETTERKTKAATGAMVEFSDANKKASSDAANAAKTISQEWDNMFLSEREALDKWYNQLHDLVAGNSAALTQLNEIYWQKVADIELQAQADQYARIKEQGDKIEAAYQEQVKAELKAMEDNFFSPLKEWYDSVPSWSAGAGAAIANTFDSFASGIGSAVADAITEGENLGQALVDVGKSAINTLIQALVQLGAQRLIVALLFQNANYQEFVGRSAALMAETHAGAFAAAVATPLIGPYIAAGIAETAVATNLAGMSAAYGMGAATAGSLAGIAHGGMDYVPKESTYLLDKGERVLSPNQNKDLMDFIAGGGSTSVNISVMPNATSASAMLSMSTADWESIATKKIIPALRRAKSKGYAV